MLCYSYLLCCDDVKKHLFVTLCIFSSATRNTIISSFPKSPSVPHLSLPCLHEQSLVYVFLSLYCNIRIFHDIKELNRNRKKGKQGSELNKKKKLNLLFFSWSEFVISSLCVWFFFPVVFTTFVLMHALSYLYALITACWADINNTSFGSTFNVLCMIFLYQSLI